MCTYRKLFKENNIRLTVLRDENKTSTKVVLDYSPRLYKLSLYEHFMGTSDEKHCTKIRRMMKL